MRRGHWRAKFEGHHEAALGCCTVVKAHMKVAAN
jgi:hypothetical protein